MRTVAYNGTNIGQHDMKITLSEPLFTGWYTQQFPRDKSRIYNPVEEDWLSSHLMSYLDSLNATKILDETTDFRRIVYSLSEWITVDFGLGDKLHIIIDGSENLVKGLESSIREEIELHRQRNNERVGKLNISRQNVFAEVFEPENGTYV